MADRIFRVGRVSSIDYETGMISVTYPDMDGATTSHLSMLTCGDEYKMPKIGDNVSVLHLPTGQSRGVVLGTYWDKGHSSRATGPGRYRKELASTPDESFFDYNEQTKTLTIKAANVVIKGNVAIQGSLTVNGVSVP